MFYGLCLTRLLSDFGLSLTISAAGPLEISFCSQMVLGMNKNKKKIVAYFSAPRHFALCTEYGVVVFFLTTAFLIIFLVIFITTQRAAWSSAKCLHITGKPHTPSRILITPRDARSRRPWGRRRCCIAACGIWATGR